MSEILIIIMARLKTAGWVAAKRRKIGNRIIGSRKLGIQAIGSRNIGQRIDNRDIVSRIQGKRIGSRIIDSRRIGINGMIELNPPSLNNNFAG